MADSVDRNDPEIVTVGAGWDERTADQAEIDIAFTVRSRDRSSAVAELGRLVTVADGALSHPALTVRHRRLHVSSERRRQDVERFAAREHLALLLTDVTALEDVLGALLAAAPTDFHGPRWSLADPSTSLRAAQQRAVADARSRAEGYAEALDRRLGPLRRLTEATESGRAGEYRMAAMAESATPDIRELGLEPEPVRVTARCTTTWALVPV